MYLPMTNKTFNVFSFLTNLFIQAHRLHAIDAFYRSPNIIAIELLD